LFSTRLALLFLAVLRTSGKLGGASTMLKKKSIFSWHCIRLALLFPAVLRTSGKLGGASTMLKKKVFFLGIVFGLH